MALILRIDVDRPYGRSPFLRHALSRLSSDLYFPAVQSFGYLKELSHVLQALNRRGARSYVFFRRCTLPSKPILDLIDAGRHEIGLHLENSRTFATFVAEKDALERRIGRPVTAMSKHGSGGAKYGFRHYAPYEADKYVEWARQVGMRTFFGNLEDPSLPPDSESGGVLVFPAAFWLEPAWRDVEAFTVDWLIDRAKSCDVVLLLHPENILSDPGLVAAFDLIVDSLPTRILE